jgi:hypothetical protein
MTSFCVFGITQETALAAATKKVKVYEQGGVMKPQHQYERELKEKAESLFETMKPIQISPAFDAPQFAQDWAGVAARTVKCRSLEVMARAPKHNKKGDVMRSKKTGRPLLAWRPYEELRAAA